MKFEQLMADFRDATGVDARPDGSGTVWLDADGVPVTVQHRQEDDAAVVFAMPLGEMAIDEAIMRQALELSAVGTGTGGFFIGISNGVLTLSAVLPLDGLDAETLGKKMLAIAGASRKVAARIGAAIADECAARHEAKKDLDEINGNQSMFRV